VNHLDLFSGIGTWSYAFHKYGIKTVAFCDNDKHNQAFLKEKFPNIPVFSDITKISFSHVYAGESYLHHFDNQEKPITEVFAGNIDIITASYPCFVSGTKVLTLDGYKGIEAVTIKDQVLTHTGNFCRVLGTKKTEQVKTMTVKIQGIVEIRCTPEHRFYVKKMKRVWNNNIKRDVRTFSNPMWVEAKNLDKSCFILQPKIKDSCNKFENFTDLDLFLLGRWVADGFLNKNYATPKLVFCIGYQKQSVWEDIIKKEYEWIIYKEKTVLKYILKNDKFFEIIKEFGYKAKFKKIPLELMMLKKEKLIHFLEGYMSGDGCFSNNGYSCGSISKELILGLQKCVQQIYETNSNMSFCKRPSTYVIEGRVVNQNDSYNLKYNKEIRKQTNAYVENGEVWLPFKKSKNDEKIETVYCIKVEKDESYTVENVAVHNCTDISLAGNKKGLLNQDGTLTRSGLFYEATRLAEQIRPRWFILENVGRQLKSQFDLVLRELSRIGYDAEWHIIRATDFKLPHQRERLFIIAYPSEFGRNECSGQERQVHINEKRSSEDSSEVGPECIAESKSICPILSKRSLEEFVSANSSGRVSLSDICRVDFGLSKGIFNDRARKEIEECRKQRIKQLGNAIILPVAEYIASRIVLENE
jgi:site-specific DNA-cytosine methylase